MNKPEVDSSLILGQICSSCRLGSFIHVFESTPFTFYQLWETKIIVWIQTADCMVDERSEVAALAHRWETRLGRGGVAELVAGAVAEALVPRVSVMRTGSPASKTIKENPIWALIYMCLHCKSNMRVTCLVSSIFSIHCKGKPWVVYSFQRSSTVFHFWSERVGKTVVLLWTISTLKRVHSQRSFQLAPWKCTHSLSCQGRCPNICQQKLVLKSSNHRTRQFIIHIACRIDMVGNPDIQELPIVDSIVEKSDKYSWNSSKLTWPSLFLSMMFTQMSKSSSQWAQASVR